eukprot:jgi/Chrzof1/5002/Cz15g08050.t1
MGAGGAATAQGPAPEVKLVGYNNFKRHNPHTDKFGIHRFHHIEFWCGDATNCYKRFQHGLGMTLVAKSDQSTGNSVYCSYVLRSNDLTITFTAPYSRKNVNDSGNIPFKHFDQQQACDFICSHGLAVRAVGIVVDDAREAHELSVMNGAVDVLQPVKLTDTETGSSEVVSEVKLYGDVVMRFISGNYKGPYLPGYVPTPDAPKICYGIRRLDHAVGNVPNLIEAVKYIMGFTGFHEFAEFVAADVGTVDSGLNSMVLANDNELVLLPINEPTYGTRRKSQIQTYLEQNEGPGLQHLALKTDDIITTLRHMRKHSELGGFEFMPRPGDSYYRKLPEKIGDDLTPEQYAAVEELGILADKDDQGVLLQIFTKPIGDRPTAFIEIIQRVGCFKEREVTNGVNDVEESKGSTATDVICEIREGVVLEQAAGCGGFGKGNFGELFKSVEDYEKSLGV